MDFFIHKLATGNSDALSHLQFEKFSRGVFSNRAIVQCKNSPKGYSIATTHEYANEFVRFLAGKLGERKTKVSGVIVSTKPLPPNISYESISQFMGIKKYSIEKELSGRELIQICDTVPRAFIGLSFSFEDNELKIKPKAPKSAKPGSDSKDGPKVDFCKLKTRNAEVVKDLFFDIGEFKQAEVNHDFVIEQIITPSDEPDPVKMREKAIRKGKIVRKLVVDGVSTVKEYAISA